MARNDLRDQLLSLAGVELEKAKDALHDAIHSKEPSAIRQFQEILQAMELIFANNTAKYGLFLDHRDADPAMGFFEQFIDLNRKYTRLRQFARAKIAGEARPFKEVLDTSLDLAVYAVMMTILAHRYSEKFDEPTASGARAGDGDWGKPTLKRDPDL